ncbi:protein disulfide isomerase [Emydomyces testavorans]|uniref:protein disulfide-isomerase n=1 Tax=Emydomyces testavorans TaxID=2070801 RepID=A0AAF0ILE2_9EURO|nr:protein disulfide isomerase [Emydomyces testavorans]
MLTQGSFVVVLAALLGALPASADGLYTKNSPVIQVNANSYQSRIAKSNYPSSLKPAYEKAARTLEGLANVAAINCDDDSNKAFCGHMRIEGFPTIKIVVPSGKSGKSRVENYQGPRSAKGIVDAVVEKIPNHVKRLTDEDIANWLADSNATAKAILFTEKGTTSALLRALAIDFLGKIHIGQIRNKETSAVGMFGITKFPTLILLPGSDKPSVIYDGELRKKPMLEFLRQVAEPNENPPTTTAKAKKSTTEKSEDFTSAEEPTASHNNTAPNQSEESVQPSAPKQPPVRPLRILSFSADLRATCLSSSTGTCVLAIVPVAKEPDSPPPVGAVSALSALSVIEHKHTLRKGHLFPFYIVPASTKEVPDIQKKLGLNPDIVEIIVINGKRGWWRRYDSADGTKYDIVELEKWIDQIRLGEGKKSTLPEGVIPIDEKKMPEEQAKEKSATPPEDGPEPKPEQEPESVPGQKSEATSSATPEPTPDQETTELPKETKTAAHEEL